ncbi:MAG: LiaF-related protein [Gaiellales bacterium]
MAADAPVAPTVEADPAAPSDAAAEDASEQPTQPSAAAFAADPTSELTTETTSEYPTFEELASPYPPPSGPVPIWSPVVADRLPEAPARRRRLPVGWITLGAILAAAATAALLDVTGALAVPVEWLLVIALGLSGIGIVVAAWYGRVRGPVALAVLSGLALMAVSVVEVPLRGGIGEQTVQPSSIDELGSEYHLGVGKLVLDLRQLSLSQPVGRVEAGVSVGELVVLLPPNAIAQVDGRASVGKVELFDRERAGVHVDESYPGPAVAGQPALLTLDLEVGVGRVEARTEATPPPGSSF